MNNIFYLHTPKCGGTSIAKCIENLDIEHLFTHKIKLDQGTLNSLKCKKGLISFGHVSHLGRNRSGSDSLVYKQILSEMYNNFSLIVPTREPANLIQSWMHYSKTRTNKLITRMISGEIPGNKFTSHDVSMIQRTMCLKQHVLRKDSTGNLTLHGELVLLNECDEEENMHRFIDFLQSNRPHWGALMSMQSELMFPRIKGIYDAFEDSVNYSIAPPKSNKNRFVFYYDSQNINSKTARFLDSVIHPNFSQELRSLRENSSLSKPSCLASEITSVTKRLKKIIPNEYAIYRLTHMM